MFETPDLYEGKALGAVVRTLLSLGRVARSIPSFAGPYIGATLATENVRTFKRVRGGGGGEGKERSVVDTWHPAAGWLAGLAGDGVVARGGAVK